MLILFLFISINSLSWRQSSVFLIQSVLFVNFFLRYFNLQLINMVFLYISASLWLLFALSALSSMYFYISASLQLLSVFESYLSYLACGCYLPRLPHLFCASISQLTCSHYIPIWLVSIFWLMVIDCLVCLVFYRLLRPS